MRCDECQSEAALYPAGHGVRLCARCWGAEAATTASPERPLPCSEIDDKAVATIVHGQHTDACCAIGTTNLATILQAEQAASEELTLAQIAQLPHGGYAFRLKLLRGRRLRLQAEEQQRQQQGNAPATFRL